MDTDKKNLFPEYPTMKQGSYAEDVDRSIKDAEERMARQEARAKRDRDMAIIGDLAGVIAQGAAMHGGAWKVDKTNSAAAQGNEKLKALQEKNIAQVAEFAKQRAAVRDAKRKEENAQKVAQYNAEVERYKREVEAEKYVKEQERKDRQEAREVQLNTAKINYYNRGGKSNGSKENKDVFLVNDDGSITTFAHADDANNIHAAYAKLPKEYKVQTDVKLYDRDEITNSPVLRIDDKGMPVTMLVEDRNATLDQKRQAIANYNARELNAVIEYVPDEDEIIDYIPNK